MTSILSRVIAGVAIAFAALPAAAQTDFPRRPITLIVPFAAGGPTDVVSRIVGEHMLLKPDSEFFRYFVDPSGKVREGATPPGTTPPPSSPAK